MFRISHFSFAFRIALHFFLGFFIFVASRSCSSSSTRSLQRGLDVGPLVSFCKSLLTAAAVAAMTIALCSCYCYGSGCCCCSVCYCSCSNHCFWLCSSSSFLSSLASPTSSSSYASFSPMPSMPYSHRLLFLRPPCRPRLRHVSILRFCLLFLLGVFPLLFPLVFFFPFPLLSPTTIPSCWHRLPCRR